MSKQLVLFNLISVIEFANLPQWRSSIISNNLRVRERMFKYRWLYGIYYNAELKNFLNEKTNELLFGMKITNDKKCHVYVVSKINRVFKLRTVCNFIIRNIKHYPWLFFLWRYASYPTKLIKYQGLIYP